MKTKIKKIEAIAITAIMIVSIFGALIPLASAATVTAGGTAGKAAIGGTGNGLGTGNTIIVTEAGIAELSIGDWINITFVDPAQGATFDTRITPNAVGTNSLAVDAAIVTSDKLAFKVNTQSVGTLGVLTIGGTTNLSVNVSSTASPATVFLNVTVVAASTTNVYSFTTDTPTVAGAGDTVYSDNDGEDSQAVTPLTITPTVAGDIGDGTNINITLTTANVTFDLSQTPDVAKTAGGITAVAVTKFTATEIGIEVTGTSDGTGAITLGGVTALKVNVSAAAPSATVVNFTVNTTPAGSSLVSQDYDALNLVHEYPGVGEITFTTTPADGIAGTTVPVIVHAASANIANYGGCVINFTITDAPTPYGSYANASWNTTGTWSAQLTTQSTGDTLPIGLVLSTRASDAQDGSEENDISVEAFGAPLSVDDTETAASQDGVETQISVEADKESAEADGADSITLTARLRDQYMNNVTAGGNATAGMGVSSDSDTAIVTPTGGVFAAGMQTIPLTNTVVEDVKVTVSTPVVGISSGSKTVTFLAVPCGIRLEANRTSAPADSASVIRLYAQLLDASGNDLALDDYVNTAFTIYHGNPIFIPASASNFDTSTNESGMAYIDLTAGAITGDDEITVQFWNGTATTQAKITLTLTQEVDASNCALTPAATQTAQAGENVLFVATVKDMNNQIIVTAPVTFKIEGGNGTLTEVADPANTASGLNSTLTVNSNSTGKAAAYFNNTVITEDDKVNVTVVETGVVTEIGNAPISITVIAANTAKIVLAPTSMAIPAAKENVTAGVYNNRTISIKLTDDYGNTNTTLTPVKVNVTSSNPYFVNLDTTNDQITATNGIGALKVTANQSTVDSTTLTFNVWKAQNTGLAENITTDNTVQVTSSGPGGVTIMANKTNPSTAEAVLLTINLTDATGNLLALADKTIVLTATGGILENYTLISNMDGQNFTNLTSTTPGPITVTAYAEGYSGSVIVTFSGNATTFVITPEKTPLSVSEACNLTIQAKDENGYNSSIYNGNPITGQAIVFMASPSGATLGTGSTTFDSTGKATNNITSATEETYTITGAGIGTSNTTTVTFTEAVIPGAPSITDHSPTSPVSDTAGATRTFNITVDQTVDVSWQMNGTVVETDPSVTEASYTNASAVVGVWNVSAIAENDNGTAMQTWTWTVTEEAVVEDLVVINEFVAARWEYPATDLIELYNPTDADVDLTDWTIVAHDPETTTAIAPLDGETIDAYGYLVYECVAEGPFSISQSGDILILKNGSVEVDRVAWGDHDDGDLTDNAPEPGLENSTGRDPNGEDTNVDIDDFSVFTTPTIGTNNTPPPGVTVTGTVKGINQEILTTTNATTVTIDGYSGATDANGYYSISGVPAGTYNVTANATGYRNETNVSRSITADMTIDFTGDYGLLKEPCDDTTYVLQVINKWAAGEIASTTKVLQQINIWAAS